MRGGASGPSKPPTGGRNGSGKAAPKEARIERRSSTRPKFVEGWRKALDQKLAESHAHAPVTEAPTGRIEIWVANPVELLRAESSLQVLRDADWDAINRIQDPTSRRSSIAARILLRIGLSRAADHEVAAADWRFAIGAYDKPVVAEGLPAIHFSTSHVDQLVVVAISPSLEIGIDVECIDQHVSKKVIADFCHLDERNSVGGLPQPQEIREFLRLWTLKEAYTKMVGLGHTLDFKMLKFTLDPVRLKVSGGKDEPAASTQFDNFYISYKHALFLASLAIRRQPDQLGATEVQIISLAKSDDRDAAHVLPLSE